MDKAAEALQYLEGRGLGPLLDRLLQRYRRQGGTGQRLAVPEGPVRDALADLLGRHISRNGAFGLSLAQLDQALQATRFAVSLEDVLRVRSGGTLLANRELRQRREDAWQTFRADMGRIAATGGLASWWERAGEEESATASYLRHHWSPERDPLLREQVPRVLAGLPRLPLSPPRRLPVFAQDLLGDPHALDLGTFAGGLLQRALEDLPLEAEEGLPLSQAERRQRVLARFGLLVDDLSSWVLVSGLAAGILPEGESDPLAALSASDPFPLILPLARLARWQEARSRGPGAFVVENASVFGALLDRLGSRQPHTLICTGGQLSTAALRLLDLLVQDGAFLRYSGDFDGAGLGIATGLRVRYGERLRTWRMDPESYREAAGRSVMPLTERDRTMLQRLEGEMPELVTAMRSTGKVAYQEALLEPMLADLVAGGSGERVSERIGENNG